MARLGDVLRRCRAVNSHVANGENDANSTDFSPNARRITAMEARVQNEICLLSLVVRTIGAERGRAARGRPEPVTPSF